MSPPAEPRSWLVRFARGFVYAGRGLAFCVRTQRNVRVQLVVATAVVAAGAWLRLDRVEWAVLALTIGGVIALEAVNTAIESAVDLASPELHPLAARAKDVAAGAVLVMSLASVVVGLLMLGPKLLARLVAS